MSQSAGPTDASGAVAEPSGGPTALLSPLAVRPRRARWRDPRLWAGALLLAVSALGGARVLAHADDSVGVWTAAHDLTAGQALGASDLVESRVRFGSADQVSRYLMVTGVSPAGMTVVHDVAAGELVSRAEVTVQTRPTPQLPLAVAQGDLPADLRPGQHVEVWAVPGGPDGRSVGARGLTEATLVLADVEVLGVSGGSDLSGSRQVLVGVHDQRGVRALLDALIGSRVVLVRVGA